MSIKVFQCFAKQNSSWNPSKVLKRLYGGVKSFEHVKDSYVIDMRSDVLTKPSLAMKKAMLNATDNDEIFREDVTVIELERKMATLFKKDAALFVPSGTMANLLAVSCHCPSRGMEVILGNKSHIFMWEQAGISQVSGLQPNAVPNLPDGTFNLDILDELIRPKDDPHQPFTGLIAVENTHNYCGGKVIPLDFLAKLQSKAQKFEIPVHIDGARILNAAVALDISPDQITQYCDSLCFCFSKGVGAPIGSVVVGSDELIRRALRMRKVLGGGWRKPGALAAAALVAMEDAMQRLKKDHEHAKYFAHEIKNIRSDLVDVDIEGVHTNIVMVKILKANLTATELCYRLSQVSSEEQCDLKEITQIRVNPARVPRSIRVCTMSNLTMEDVKRAIRKWQYILTKL